MTPEAHSPVPSGQPPALSPELQEKVERLAQLPGSKIVRTPEEAVQGIASGQTLSVGGFGLNGIPQILIDAVLASGADDLSVASNNAGVDGIGLAVLLEAGRLRKMMSSYVGENKEFARQYLAGELEVELMPQGTLAERMRAGGSGIGGFFTQAGVGTQVAEGGLPQKYAADGSVEKASQKKETRTIRHGGEDTEFVFEEAIVADMSLVHAWKADVYGNLVFNKAARNFNPVAAMSGKTCVIQVEEIVEPGEIDPDSVHLPSAFVDRILVVGPDIEKPIEKRTTRPAGEPAPETPGGRN
ncbi:CoA transferase subunit A [Arthrobacter sp. UM1]|uniref:CoA transferase subunit A n=1 Tax=Arthrobacter sp. UM1 TaxID=2766776 RepID=UPI0039AF169D|nr:CoA transferase subunit A [Arthrobacter sp. UM1]